MRTIEGITNTNEREGEIENLDPDKPIMSSQGEENVYSAVHNMLNFHDVQRIENLLSETGKIIINTHTHLYLPEFLSRTSVFFIFAPDRGQNISRIRLGNNFSFQVWAIFLKVFEKNYSVC